MYLDLLHVYNVHQVIFPKLATVHVILAQMVPIQQPVAIASCALLVCITKETKLKTNKIIKENL